jgi:hypothetical protein
MRKRSLSLLLLFLPVFGANQVGSKTPVPPNLYRLTGGKMQVNYSTTSVNGQPRFSYQDGAQTLSFAGDQIRQTQTEIGTLVSVTLHMTVDSGSTEFTLLLPAVNLAGASATAPVRTYGITTAHRFSVVPAANQGQTALYTMTELSGTASLVVF